MQLFPGTVVALDVGPYYHVGIVSGVSAYGEPLVISSSARCGMACEEPLSAFLDGGKLIVLGFSDRYHPDEVIRRARSRLGRRWNLFTANCEHLVNFACGHAVESPQLHAVVTVVCLVLGARLLLGR